MRVIFINEEVGEEWEKYKLESFVLKGDRLRVMADGTFSFPISP